MTEIAALGAAAVLGVFVPWVLMRMLIPALRRGRVVENYRGEQVFLGLGIAWLVWAGCAIVGGVASSALSRTGEASVLPILTLAGPLALVAFALGIVDDALGGGEAKGFRGHLSALGKGRLTTGGLKLIGISAASFVVALILSEVSPWGTGDANSVPSTIVRALAAGAAVALTSNFVNLTDLRPGRALKVSSALLLLGVVSAGLFLRIPDSSTTGLSPARLVDTVALALYGFGPVVAVWRYDLSGQGMLGDAGANPLGAVAGLLIVSGLPLWGLVLYLGIMLALNLSSERVSFSRVIESNSVLRWLDNAGRSPVLRESATHEGHKPE